MLSVGGRFFQLMGGQWVNSSEELIQKNDANSIFYDGHAYWSRSVETVCFATRCVGGDAEYAGQRLPEAAGIKSEYQNSGTWKNQPTG